ncbi:GNAT family N-acetyltransferase, partial [Bifidobacterium longum]
MTIRIEAYDRLPDAARAIREQVFIRERDWRPEFDEWDAASVHLLVFNSDNDAPNRPGPSAQSPSPIQSVQPDQNHPVATCRFYTDPDHPDQPGRYIIARLAVLPEAQGKRIGSRLLADAERRIAQA